MSGTNPQVAAALHAIAAEDRHVVLENEKQRAREQVVATARMRVSQTEEFAEVRKVGRKLIADNTNLVVSVVEPHRVYRAQGAIWGLEALLAYFDGAEGELRELETAPE